MKHISIASLVCGTVIILAPMVHSIVTLALLAHLLAVDSKAEFHLHGMLDQSYESWCLFIGFCLLASGTITGFRSRGAPVERDAKREPSVPAPASPLSAH